MTFQPPWKEAPLKEWSIVGMNHYSGNAGRMLYVAMVNGDQCIRAEGKDDEKVWRDLCVQTILVRFPKWFILDFDPAKSEEAAIKTIFSDRYGGLVWCALRHGRLADQHFNEKVAKMLTQLRALPGVSNRWLSWPDDIHEALPRGIFGNCERLDYWAEALHRMVSTQQGVWAYKVNR